MEPLEGERKPQRFLSWAFPPVWRHLPPSSSRVVWRGLCVPLAAVSGAAFSGDFHSAAMSVPVAPSLIFWETVWGHWLFFPLLWEEETSKPLPLYNFTWVSLHPYKFSHVQLFLQSPASRFSAENKWCQVKLVKSRREESPAMIWCAFFPQEMFVTSQCLCPCCVLLRSMGRVTGVLIAEV